MSGCELDGTGLRPPSWRPDLLGPIDLVEEVARVVGYDTIPSRGPALGTGVGSTSAQRLERRLRRRPASWDWSRCYPFVGAAELDALGAAGRRPARNRVLVTLANPLSDEQPHMRTTVLPGNPEHAALLLCGAGPGQAGGVPPGPPTPDTIRLSQEVAETVGVTLEVIEDVHAPWHPGRCARLSADGRTVGHAGELHPDVVAAYGLPARSSAAELDLSVLLELASPVAPAPRVSTFPVAKEDVALVVDERVSAESLRRALGVGGGDLLESVRLFDMYSGPQVPEGKKSLAFSLRLRASDRTLTDEDIAAVREGALAAAGALGAPVSRLTRRLCG